MFAQAHAEKKNPVWWSLKMPKLRGKELESELARYFKASGDIEKREFASAAEPTVGADHAAP